MQAHERIPIQFIRELEEACTCMESSGLSSAMLPTLGSTIWLDASSLELEITLDRALEAADDTAFDAVVARVRLLL